MPLAQPCFVRAENQRQVSENRQRSANPKVRAGVARVIGNIGDPASSEQIRPLTDDSNTDVVREAVAALRKLSR